VDGWQTPEDLLLTVGDGNLDKYVKVGMQMKKEPNFDQKYDFFSARKLENIVIINFKESPLLRAPNLHARDLILDYLDLVSRSDPIKVFVIIGPPQETGLQEYVEFYRKALELKLDQSAIYRMYNVVDQLILRIVDLNKIVVHADTRKFISLFLNVSFAFDFRIVADNAVFQNPRLELGLVPKGGVTFFLSKTLNLSKAVEILLSEKDITAQEAMRLGFVNKVVPLDELEEAAIKIAQRFAQKPARSLLGVKRLLNYSMKDLKDYLVLENQVLWGAVRSSDFREKLGEYTEDNFTI